MTYQVKRDITYNFIKLYGDITIHIGESTVEHIPIGTHCLSVTHDGDVTVKNSTGAPAGFVRHIDFRYEID